MTDDRLSRLGPLSGVLFVVLELGGVIVGAASGRAMATLGDPASKVMDAFNEPAGTGVWVGAYMELVSLAAFGVFAVWLFRSRRDMLGTAGLVAAAVWIAVTLAALVAGDVLEYRAGHGMGVQETLLMFDLQAGLFTTTWGIGGAFLLLAPVTGWLKRSAQVIAAMSIIGMAFPKATFGQFGATLFLVWVLVAAIVLARRPERMRASAPVPAGA